MIIIILKWRLKGLKQRAIQKNKNRLNNPKLYKKNKQKKIIIITNSKFKFIKKRIKLSK